MIYSLILLVFVICDKLPCPRIDGSYQEENNPYEHKGLDLINGHSSFNVELGQCSFASDNFSNDGEGNAKLSHPPHKELICLGKAKGRTYTCVSKNEFLQFQSLLVVHFVRQSFSPKLKMFLGLGIHTNVVNDTLAFTCQVSKLLKKIS